MTRDAKPEKLLLPQVPTSADCGPDGGWWAVGDETYSKFTLCPASCAAMLDNPQLPPFVLNRGPCPMD